MALDPAFAHDCPYGPGGLLLDEVIEIDVERSRVVARMPTHDDLPLTREQRVHPLRHPRHVSGGLMVHMTGMVGFVHAYYVLGLRHSEGWIGYGGRVHSARFRAMATPGQPLLLECIATQTRRSESKILVRYDFAFTQAGKLVYEGDQTALWLKVPLRARVIPIIEPPRGPVDVLIESPRFSHIKRKPNGSIDFISPLPCPFNYGCVPQFISGDGDPIDVVLLGPRIPRGSTVQATVVGVVDFVDAGDADPKWICSNAPVTNADRISVHAFFLIYAVAKGALNTVRGKHGITVYRELTWCAAT